MRDDLAQKITELCNQLYGVSIELELSRPEPQFGDYTTNVAMKLAGNLNKNPREIATALAEEIRQSLADIIQEVTVAGPGFINLKLTQSVLVQLIDTQLEKSLKNQKILVEYSDPNPFKPLHAGHLYTTLVGDVMARLVEIAGAETVRLNYGGDVGRHVAISMWAIIKNLSGEHPDKLGDIAIEDRASWLGRCYVEGTAAFETDETAKAEILVLNKRVYDLQAAGDHDSPFAKIYWICRDWSYEFFEKLYSDLEVHKFDRIIPESEVTPLGLKVVHEQLERGVYEKSDGAVVFRGEKYGLHTRVFINSQGLPTYECKDVGLMYVKWNDYHYDLSYYITASEQAEYMAVMFKSVEQFEPVAAERARSLTHGVVKLAGGVKMSSRKGNTVTAEDILVAAREASAEYMEKPNSQTVLAAIKYSFLKNRIGGDIVYDPKESVSMEGNSGPYLQYAHARARSILRKAEPGSVDLSQELQDDERLLAQKISEYAEVVNRSVSEMMPHHICSYLYELAQTFNRFYEKNRVVDDPRQETRLWLVDRYSTNLKRGLELMGISAPEKM